MVSDPVELTGEHGVELVERERASTVSPGGGIVGTPSTTSRFALPTTTTTIGPGTHRRSDDHSRRPRRCGTAASRGDFRRHRRGCPTRSTGRPSQAGFDVVEDELHLPLVGLGLRARAARGGWRPRRARAQTRSHPRRTCAAPDPGAPVAHDLPLLGFGLPVSGSWATPGTMLHVAQRAESLGYASFWTFQRVL